MGFINIALPDTPFNKFLLKITGNIGIKALIPISFTILCNGLFSNTLIVRWWSGVNPFIMKIIYNSIDMLFEYTAICLANIGAQIAELNLGTSIFFSLVVGQMFVVDFYALLKLLFYLTMDVWKSNILPLYNFANERRDNWCLFGILIIPIIILTLLIIPLAFVMWTCSIPIILIIFAFHETLT